MTKQADEIALKAHLSLDEANKVVESTVELVCDEALVGCGAVVEPVEIAPLKVKVNAVRNKRCKVMPELYDLEQGSEAEKPLNVDLDLYQMENY
ncbi:MAG: hypothetical protein NWE94_01600 [Candidatus Bathyarchaeota archaeon]|nr:hypothetical protein [Candidatus Bathyarchaeota archaeon]